MIEMIFVIIFGVIILGFGVGLLVIEFNDNIGDK